MSPVPMNNAGAADPLAELRDIHLPEAISWWPLAPGWWLLIALALIIAAALFFYRHWRKLQKSKPVIFSTQQVMQAALLELSAIEQTYAACERPSEEAGRRSAADISQLLRRSAIQLTQSNHNPDTVAGLTGETWMSWLDSRWDRDDFTQGTGHILIDAPYRSDFSHNSAIDELFTLCRVWLEQQR